MQHNPVLFQCVCVEEMNDAILGIGEGGAHVIVMGSGWLNSCTLQEFGEIILLVET